MPKKILVIDDEPKIVEICQDYLLKAGFDVVHAYDGPSGLAVAQRSHPDLVVLDLMLPAMDGLDVCRELRRESNVPIIMLTARVEEADKLIGLELGADDYITKPFSLRELLARIRAMLRRAEMLKQEAASREEAMPAVMIARGLEVDLARHQVSLGGSILDLSPKEFELLVFLMRNRSRAFTRDYLLEKVWGYDYAGDSRTVDVHIRWLRQKIEADPSRPQYLLTVRGYGYKFEG